MNITISVDRNKLFKSVDNIDAQGRCKIENEIEAVLYNASIMLSQYGVNHFELNFEGDIIFKHAGTIHFTDFANIECTIPVLANDNRLTLLDSESYVNSKILYDAIFMFIVSNIKVKNLKK